MLSSSDTMADITNIMSSTTTSDDGNVVTSINDDVVSSSSSSSSDVWYCGYCKLPEGETPPLDDGESLEDVHYWIQCDTCTKWYHGK